MVGSTMIGWRILIDVVYVFVRISFFLKDLRVVVNTAFGMMSQCAVAIPITILCFYTAAEYSEQER